MPGVVRTIRAPLGYAIVTCVITGHLITEPYAALSMWQNLVAILVAVVACVRAAMLLHYRLPNPERTMMLAGMVHEEIRALTCKGITMLCPPDSDSKTVHLRIGMMGDTVVVKHVKWDEHHDEGPSRKFMIEPSGRIVRRSNDRAWHQASLVHQLEGLLAALQGSYVPRVKVSKVRREDR